MTISHPWLVKRDCKWGCIVCAVAHKNKAVSHRHAAFPHFQVAILKTGNVRRHENSRSHKSAMVAAGLLPAASQDNDNDGVPSAETIMQFWENRRTGSSLVVATEGFTRGDKNGKRNRKLEWIIAEARRSVFRQFITSSIDCSVTLTQDGRGKHLLVRANACSDQLRTAAATMSIVTTQGGATNLCVGTLTALEEFCTEGLGRPYGFHPDAPAPQLDHALLKKLCAGVAWWFTDAAFDEFAAGEYLFSRAEARRLFKNLAVVGRERAHASRRVLSRPQSADAYLTEVSNRFLWNYDSMASIIQHTTVGSDVWCTSGRSDPAASQIVTLRFRRHRFDAQAEALTRMVLTMDALLQTASALSNARKAEVVGKSAAAFLQWATDEALLQLGMLADASDQVMLLVRSNDVDEPDPATMAALCG